MEIVAEFTYNHLGDIDRAMAMVDAAKQAGASCIKFELRNNKGYFKNYPELKSKKEQHELNDDMLAQLVNYCRLVNIGWFASVHDIISLHKIMPLKPRYIKVASREARIVPFLVQVKNINAKTLPVIISTGGLSFLQIEEIYELMKDEQLTLLHTSCLYPCPVEHLNMNRIITMKEQFNCNIGYSGHEQGFLPSLYAATLDITYIERHFTLEDEDMAIAKGRVHFTDELCTLGPKMFKEMTSAIKIIKQLKAQPAQKEVFEPELKRVNAYGTPAWSGMDVYLH